MFVSKLCFGFLLGSLATTVFFPGKMFAAFMDGDDQPITLDEGPVLSIGGVFRFNYLYTDWDGSEDNRNKGGELLFDTFRINVHASYRDLYLASEYRFYSGYHMLKSGYVGYEINDFTEVQVGMNQVPFGILTFASNNWFFQIPYYLGLEDSYASGMKFMYQRGPLQWQVAGYLNDGGSYTGNSLGSARYSYDVVHTDDSELGYADSDVAPLDFDRDPLGRRQNSMSNQLNIRGAYTYVRRSLNIESGVSGQIGQLYNSATRKNGNHRAVSAHINASWDRWQLMLQALRYEYHPENPERQNDQIVVMGAYDAPYKVAAEANVYSMGLNYSLPLDFGPVSNITFYNDYSFMQKDHPDFHHSQQNVLGMMISAGQVFTYVDWAVGKNHSWLGPDYGSAFAEGRPDAPWNTRFNINVGYYF